MKWIKASERTPTELGKVHWRDTGNKMPLGAGVAHSIINLRELRGKLLETIEWLDEESPIPDKVEINEIVLDAMDFYWRALTDKLNGKDLGDIERKNYEVLTAKLYKLLKQ